MPRLAKPDIKVEETPKITCICCGKANQKDFYESANPFQKYYGKIPYCKDCIKGVMWDYYCKKYHNNYQMALHGLLRALDLPYIHSIYLIAAKMLENANTTFNASESSAIISTYMAAYGSRRVKNGYGCFYSDSEGLGEIQGVAVYEDTIKIKRKRKQEDEKDRNTEKYEYLDYDADELVEKWGEFEDDKLIKLELEWLDWCDKLGDYMNDKSVELVVRQVCHQTVEIQEKRERGEKVKDEITALQALLSGSGLIEKTREKNAETVKIGQTIKEIENSHPIEAPREELIDVDGYNKLLDTFIGAMSRTLGKENIFTEKFNEYYKKYSVDFDRIAKSQEGTERKENGY